LLVTGNNHKLTNLALKNSLYNDNAWEGILQNSILTYNID
jgi:hypothetical protein